MRWVIIFAAAVFRVKSVSESSARDGAVVGFVLASVVKKAIAERAILGEKRVKRVVPFVVPFLAASPAHFGAHIVATAHISAGIAYAGKRFGEQTTG